MKNKDLKYWQERGGQIEWRLEVARRKVSELEQDLDECDRFIKELMPVERANGYEDAMVALEKAKQELKEIENENEKS